MDAAQLGTHEVRARLLDQVLGAVGAVEKVGDERGLPDEVLARRRRRALATARHVHCEHIARFERASVAEGVPRGEQQRRRHTRGGLEKACAGGQAVRGRGGRWEDGERVGGVRHRQAAQTHVEPVDARDGRSVLDAVRAIAHIGDRGIEHHAAA